MPRIRYVGKPSPWHGKALFEILVNLKDFGVGRMVVRNNFERYKEPTYYIIKKVQPQMDKENKLGSAWVDVTFRGRPMGVEEIKNVWVTDYKLIPKCEEEAYKKFDKSSSEYLNDRILPPLIDPPPLLKEFLAKENNGNVPEIPRKLIDSSHSRARIAKPGETPNVIPGKTLGLFLENLSHEDVKSPS